MIKKIKKITNSFLDSVLDKSLNPDKRNLIYSFIFYLLKKRLFLNILCNYRAGNISKAWALLQSYQTRTQFEQKIKDRVEEMQMILNKGWPEEVRTKTEPCGFNSRVLLALHNSLPHDGAGYAIRSHHIVRHLQKAGLKPHVLTRLNYPWDLNQHRDRPYAPSFQVQEVTYHRVLDENVSIGGRESAYIEAYAKKLAETAKVNHSYILHAASNYLNGLAAAKAANLIQGKSIYEVRGMWHWSRGIKEPYFQGSDHQHYCEIMEKAAVSAVDRVVAISQGLKDQLISWGIAEDKISVISNAVDTETFKPLEKNETLKKDLGLQGRYVLGFIGTLTLYEGVDLILKAGSELIQEGWPLSLLIVGNGLAYNHLTELAASLPGAEHIHFPGYVPYEQIQNYYSIIDIFPFPRKDYQVCRVVPPLKIFEVMAMQKPVVISDLPALREIVQDKDTGLVCQSDDVQSLKLEIERLLADHKLTNKLGTSAREHVKAEHSWEKMAQRYLELYQEICPG